MTTTNNANSEFIPYFTASGEYSIFDRISGKLFDCRKSKQVREACDIYKILTYPTPPYNKQNITRLYYRRVLEYLIKHKKPDIPNPFNTIETLKTPKGIGELLKAISPDTKIRDDIAKCIVKLFTTSDINIAIEKCRITDNTHKKYKENFVKIKKEKQVAANENNDLFNNQDKTGNDKDDNFHSILFSNVDKSDFIKVRERCELIRNVVHLYTCNNIEFEWRLSETERVTNNYLLEKTKQEIKSCLDTETNPERIKEILKFITDK